MKLPSYVEKAIELLEKNIYEVYVVGGAVRDYLLGKTPADYDLSTNATPEEIKKVFINYYTISTGIKHGTISVLIDNNLLEITTYREEAEYLDYRRPSKVNFVKSIEKDLARRDFTINAICYNKHFLDLFNGRKDLKNKIIKAIGDPHKRFSEDALRVLRALRFSSTLDFEIETNTKLAIYQDFPLLEKVAKERINIELTKLLLGVNPSKVFIEFGDYFEKYILKFKLNPIVIKYLNQTEQDLKLRLVFLCVDLKKEEVVNFLKELKYPNRIIKDVSEVIDYINLEIPNTESGLLKLLKNINYECLGIVLKIKNILNNNQYEEIFRIYKNLKDKVVRLNNLKINGNDLKKVGFKEGIQIKIILNKLLDDVILGLPNEKEVLIAKAKEYYKNGLDGYEWSTKT